MNPDPETRRLRAHRVLLRDLGVTCILLSSHPECEKPEISALIVRAEEAINLIIEEMRRRKNRASK